MTDMADVALIISGKLNQKQSLWFLSFRRWHGQVVQGAGFEIWRPLFQILPPTAILRRVHLGYSGRYSGIYSGYSAPGSRIAGMEIQVFRNENSSQKDAYSHYSSYSYSGLIPNERALNLFSVVLSSTP